MPRVNGIYSLPPVYYAENGTTIMPNQHNTPLEDVANALTQSLPRNGSAAMTGDLNMSGRKVTGLGPATAPDDAVRLDQALPNTGWLASVSALTMAADRIPYATGVSTAAMAVFTAAGRAVVGAVDAAAQRVALGLGALATKNKASVTDIDATGTASAATFLRGDGVWAGALGVGQTWQDVTASRPANTTFTNSTGRPIQVVINYSGIDGAAPFIVDGIEIGDMRTGLSEYAFISVIIPNGSRYRFNLTARKWSELR